MELYQIVMSFGLPITMGIFLWIERRSIMNLISDFRVEKDSGRKEVSEEEIIEKMNRILGYRYADRP